MEINIKDILKIKEIEGYNFLGELQINKCYQWLWKEIEGVERIIILSIIIDENKIDALIDDNYGFLESIIGDFKEEYNIDNIEKLKQWINANLYTIGHMGKTPISIFINNINEHLSNVFEILNLGKYQPVGFIIL